ncbi:MAG: Rpn family recombination-promoting nuclease/putative transposase [Gammaproteobacteria bacterium]|nr:Rpn family recombination-promoting nuclease/putative transposase [Gammaproteobacteria bacterium]
MSFLNAVLPLPADRPIVDLTYLPSEQVPVIPEFKRTIADARCTDSHGRVFIVEMQMNWTDSFKQRLLFGTSQAFVKQIEQGQTYKLLEPVYGLGLVAEVYETKTTDWYHHYQLIKKEGQEEDVIDHLQLIFIELPKFPVHSPEEKKLKLLWLRFLREINEKTQTVSEELLTIPEIAKAVQLTEESAYSKAELAFYESYWDQVSREKTLLSEKYTEGKAEGFAEGEAKGKAEGLAEGKAEGKAEGRVEIAKKLRELGAPLSMITESTGLTAEEIEALH